MFPRSDIWLFDPRDQTMTIGETCDSNQVTFLARRGLFIDGSTNPPVSEANVTLYRFQLDTDQDSSVDIDGQSMILLASSSTDANGTFHFGPLSNTRSYDVRIHKVGHVFTRLSSSSYNFQTEKLASILVRIKDVDGAFLVLTSSTNTMRRRTATTDSTGEVLFTDLQPGNYYIRPQLREYQFFPEDSQIELKSGDEIISSFDARRIAFSCFGQVTSINNEPEFGLIIDAIGIEQCEHVPRESAKTDLNGHFRLRALQPSCRYRLQYRSNPTDSHQSMEIIHLQPQSQLIETIDADLHHIHLYTIKRPVDIDINVFVQTPTQFLNQLKVSSLSLSLSPLIDHSSTAQIKLYKFSQRESPLQTITLTQSPFAYFNAIPFDNEVRH